MELGESRTAVPGGDAVPNGRTGARCFRPSRRRTSRMLAGRSSTPQSTSTRHSGQRSSRRELTMFSRQRRQNVCWHGSTLALASSRSRHTEHSSKSNSDDSSIFASIAARAALTHNHTRAHIPTLLRDARALLLSRSWLRSVAGFFMLCVCVPVCVFFLTPPLLRI